MATKVFISYRRDDSAGHAGRVHDRLEREFGRDLLFMDVDAVPLGVNFVKVLSEEVAKCDVLVAVIGPNWLNARDEDGNRRLDNPHDFVRIEIGAALQRNIPVIPILLDGAKVPKPNQLPKELEEFSLRNGLDVRHASFHNDIDRLVQSLKGQLADADARRHDEDERRRQEAEIKQRADEEERRRNAEAEKRQRDEEERRRQEIRQAEVRRIAEEERRQQEAEIKRRAEAEKRQRAEEEEARRIAEEERRREEAVTKRLLDEAEAEKRRQDKERRKLEKEAAWAAKKERLHPWRGAVAACAVVVALLMVGGIWLYRTTTPAEVTSGVQARYSVLVSQSKTEIDNSDYDRAIATASEAIRLNPNYADAFFYRGIAYVYKGDNDRVIADLNEAIRLNPNFAAAFFLRGHTYANKGDNDRAIADYDEAIRLDPKYASAFCGRGNAKLKIKDASGKADIAKARALDSSICQ